VGVVHHPTTTATWLEIVRGLNSDAHGLCVAVDPTKNKFAIGTNKYISVHTSSDLVELGITADDKVPTDITAALVTMSDNYIRLRVSVKDSVRAYYEFGASSGGDQTLREIYAQLKSMKPNEVESTASS